MYQRRESEKKRLVVDHVSSLNIWDVSGNFSAKRESADSRQEESKTNKDNPI